MILLIGGTSETAPLAAGIAAAGYTVLVSTATDAPLAIGDHPRISRRAGRLDEAGMVALGKEKEIRAIVDGAHPYATAAHAVAQAAARRLDIPCLTFRRPKALLEESGNRSGAAHPNTMEDTAGRENCRREAPRSGARPDADLLNFSGYAFRFAAGHAEAAMLAFADGRPVLLTTGSRNLAPYAAEARRTGIPLAARILDSPESLAACREAGIAEDRIITGRGPFTLDENLAGIRRFGIGVIVTKESGRAGGVDAKLAAARAGNCLLVVIRRPELPDAGLLFDRPEELIEALGVLLPPRLDRIGAFPLR